MNKPTTINTVQEIVLSKPQRAVYIEHSARVPHSLPIGYRTEWIDGIRRVLIDEEVAELIRFAFSLHETNKFSYMEIAVEMAKRGLVGKSGNKIGSTGTWKMLKNPLYVGSHPMIPAIISTERITPIK